MGSQRMDYMTKLFKYRTAGVREYWIVDPTQKKILVYIFGNKEDFMQYSFEEEIPAGIYPEFKINIAELLKI